MIDVGPVTIKNKQPNGSWSPVLVSMLVYPGIGQLMQRRITAFLVFTFCFTLMAVIFSSIVYGYIEDLLPMLQMALEGQVADPATFPSMEIIAKPSAALTIIYLANVFDVIRGRYKIRQNLAQK